MNGKELQEILTLDEFKKDLRELSWYLASIKQERPIIFSIAKCLWKRGTVFQMEERRRDLVVGETYLEFKYSYDCDMEKVADEMARYREKPIEAMVKDVKRGLLKGGWSQCAPIIKGMFVNKPDIFVWIIHSRDLSEVRTAVHKRINWFEQQRNWSKSHPYNDRRYLDIADQFLAKMREVKPFSIVSVEISVKKQEMEPSSYFPSTYHFRICDFTIKERTG